MNSRALGDNWSLFTKALGDGLSAVTAEMAAGESQVSWKRLGADSSDIAVVIGDGLPMGDDLPASVDTERSLLEEDCAFVISPTPRAEKGVAMGVLGRTLAGDWDLPKGEDALTPRADVGVGGITTSKRWSKGAIFPVVL